MSLFNEAKTTQAAARLLKLRGGRMSYLKLLKLLYLVDRASLAYSGRPITFDDYYSMGSVPEFVEIKKGPFIAYHVRKFEKENGPWNASVTVPTSNFN